ncbi:MAG: alanine--tRNA ligase [Andreesenia angusta]|nr:alanine--tRNA ligase [Andreesenia angusta]
MKYLGLHELRKIFLDFFREKDHLVRKSYPLVPINDKSLLLINAGMAPLKPYFLGTEEPPKRRMATSQKCVRTADIENVGKTARHATFFEMLGNFSFGDYFKREAIKWSWEFMTERLEIPEDVLWISVYLEDDESFDIWNKEIGVPKEKIVKLGKEDNFWELEVGPCGPCSEIYIDRGEDYACEDPNCKPGCECDRYVEVWNLVFSEFDKDEKGNYNLLEKPNIDTGMGLERIAAIMQRADNIFEVDAMKEIISEIEKISGKKYSGESDEGMSFRVITDHVRAMTFLISDGILPSNEGRGYILRRLIRRAARHGRLLGIEGKFLSDMVSDVIESWKCEYDELSEKQDQIMRIVSAEEEKFQETIDQGMNILDSYIDKMSESGDTILSGQQAFKLYDTYGFPLDLTKEILEEKGYEVDEDSFEIEMDRQRTRARDARADSDTSGWNQELVHLEEEIESEFQGYDSLNMDVEILAIFKDGERVDKLSQSEEGLLILKETPFYAEGGGQVGDTGLLFNENLKIEVLDTQKSDKVIVNFIKIIEGNLSEDDKLRAEVDRLKRMGSQRNHSVTHLLHQGLKDVLGEHVNQAGSLVMPDRLRFDFTHFSQVSDEELQKIEDLVNEKILDDLEVSSCETTIEDARSQGAQALFGEKYGDVVRLVSIGDYSKELCGGTHVKSSSQIGSFKIISEGGVAAGIRRIEAVTGIEAYKYNKEINRELKEITDILKTNRDNLFKKARTIMDSNKQYEKEIHKLKRDMAKGNIDSLISEKEEIEDTNLLVKRIDGYEAEDLRNMADNLRDKIGSGMIVLSSYKDGKIFFVAMATKDIVKRGAHAGNILREIAKMTGGGGGGRPDMAQAGGKDEKNLEKAMKSVKDILISQLL